MKAAQINRLIEDRMKGNPLYDELRAALERMREELAVMAKCAKAPMDADLAGILVGGGKRLRSTMAFLCYRMGGKRDMDIIPLMCMLELMHTASLIHDDVVDGADTRRDIPTINSTKGNMAAVQSGDFLLAKAMELLHIYRGTGINEELAEVSYQMTMGEFRQQAMRYAFDTQSKASYFELINKKTAALLAASCYCGAVAGGMKHSSAAALRRFGKEFGTAFQLRNDLLDYSDEAGKAPGQDIQNGIFTLPVLELLEGGVPDEVRGLLQKREKTEDEVLRLTEYVKSTGAPARAGQTVSAQSRAAARELRELPSCPERKALEQLAMSVANARNRGDAYGSLSESGKR